MFVVVHVATGASLFTGSVFPQLYRFGMVDYSAELYHAVTAGNSNKLERLIDLGADVDQAYDDRSHRKTILHFACGKGNEECVKLLLEHGASVNVRDKWRMTPIMYCTSICNYDVMKMLVQNDPETVNTQDTHGESALHIAARSGAKDVIRLLLDMGADVNLQNSKGFTPLMSIMFSKDIANYIELMRILIDAGTDIRLYSYRDQRTALHIAVITKKVDAVEYLLYKGSDPNHIDVTGKSPLVSLLGYHVTSSQVTDDVMTIAVLLVQYGADMNNVKFKDECCNPLLMACHVKSHQFVRFFLESGADVNVTFPYSGATPLLMSVKQNDIDTVRELMNWSCRMDPVGRCRIRGENDYDEFMFDSLQLAVHRGFWDIVHLMIRNGYNVSKITYVRNEYSNVPASLKKNPDMLEKLQQFASTPNSLFKSCSLTIFGAIKSNIRKKLDLLPLPSSILKYLQFHYTLN